MRSAITERGYTEIPEEIRRRYKLTSEDSLEWVVETDGIKVVPIPADPIRAFRGSGKGRGTERLIADRREESLKQ